MRVRNKICEIVDEKFTPDNAAILKYILAGFKKDLDRDYVNRLQRSGVSRGLYSPYFHMTLILSFVWLVFGNIKTRNRRIVICVLCVLYLCVNPYLPSGRKLFTYIIISEFLKDRTGIFRPMDAFRASILICGLQIPTYYITKDF